MSDKHSLFGVAASIAFFVWYKQAALFSLFQGIYHAAAKEWPWLVLAVILLFILHFIKMIRYYLILSESQLPLREYLRLYLQVTLVNILIPFKLGEIFRFSMVAGKCKSARLSILSIISERFFDTCIIVAVLIAQVVFLDGEFAAPLLFLALFVVVCFLIYWTYSSTSRYLNRFFVLKPPKHSDLYYLQTIDYIDDLYDCEQKIIKGKGSLVLICSILAWLTEYFFFVALAESFSLSFNMDIFSKYISSILMVSPDFPPVFNTAYCVICICIFTILYIWTVCYKKAKGVLCK